MGGRNGSQVRRRVLARELRALREEAGLTLEDAAARLDLAPSTLSRTESGQQQISVHVVKSMLDVYRADDRWDELPRLARASRQRGWWQAFGLGERTHLVGLETEATRVREFTPTYLPGLLQTADYARALFVAAMVWDSGPASGGRGGGADDPPGAVGRPGRSAPPGGHHRRVRAAPAGGRARSAQGPADAPAARGRADLR